MFYLLKQEVKTSTVKKVYFMKAIIEIIADIYRHLLLKPIAMKANGNRALQAIAVLKLKVCVEL